MNSKIPLPTDNIYKFYALFGLVLLISSFVLFFQTYTTFQERFFERYIALESLTNKKKLSANDLANKEVLETKSKIDESDKSAYLGFIGIFIAFSLFLIAYGFRKWHVKIQPQQDLVIQKQIEKLTLEIKALKKQSHKPFKGEN